MGIVKFYGKVDWTRNGWSYHYGTFPFVTYTGSGSKLDAQPQYVTSRIRDSYVTSRTLRNVGYEPLLNYFHFPEFSCFARHVNVTWWKGFSIFVNTPESIRRFGVLVGAKQTAPLRNVTDYRFWQTFSPTPAYAFAVNA